MTKQQLVGIVAKRAHMPRSAASEAIDVFIDEIQKALQKGDKIVLSGFGSFVVTKVKEKRVVPFGKAEKEQIIKGHKIVTFKPGRPLRKLVW